MKKLLIALAMITTPYLAFAGANIGVEINLGHPDFYGQVEIGNMAPPPVIYAQPVVIQGSAYGVQPLYLRVPPDHANNWRRYCGEYNACGRPVYFVKDDWYRETYAPQYRHDHYDEHHDDHHHDDDHHDHGHHHDDEDEHHHHDHD